MSSSSNKTSPHKKGWGGGWGVVRSWAQHPMGACVNFKKEKYSSSVFYLVGF